MRRLIPILKIRFTIPPRPRPRPGWATWLKRYYIQVNHRRGGILVRSQWQTLNIYDYPATLQTTRPCANCGFFIRNDAGQAVGLREDFLGPLVERESPKGGLAICPYCLNFPLPRYRWDFSGPRSFQVKEKYLPSDLGGKERPGGVFRRKAEEFMSIFSRKR